MKILNFGSLNIDNVYAVDHFVRPGETTSSEGMKTFCGGKGLNQSIAISRAGAEVYHAGCIGKDGEMLKICLQQNNVNTQFLGYVNCPTGHAIIQVDKNGQNCILLYGGANQNITTDYIDSVFSNFEKGDLLLLQNEICYMEYIMETAYKNGMIIALNPSPINDKLKSFPLHYVKYFLLNEIEGNELTEKVDADSIAEELLNKYNEACIVLTLGKKGILYLDKHQKATHGVYNVKLVDTTAAGDTFTGYFLAGITEKLPIEKILEIASKASSISVSRSGASDSIPFRNEVEQSNLYIA